MKTSDTDTSYIVKAQVSLFHFDILRSGTFIEDALRVLLDLQISVGSGILTTRALKVDGELVLTSETSFGVSG